MKQFVFLYPTLEVIDFEIDRGVRCVHDDDKEQEFLQRLSEAKSKEEEETIRQEVLQEVKSEFRSVYVTTLNACIDARYRKRGFEINYAVHDGSPVSDVIDLQESDRIIEVGLDFKTHTTKQSNGKHPYPDENHILNQLNRTSVIRIAGFHMWDCVERLARRAYERGLDTLVDEDLTEFFNGRLFDSDFEIDRYPTYNPRKQQGCILEIFIEARKEKPWLWQDY